MNRDVKINRIIEKKNCQKIELVLDLICISYQSINVTLNQTGDLKIQTNEFDIIF